MLSIIILLSYVHKYLNKKGQKKMMVGEEKFTAKEQERAHQT